MEDNCLPSKGWLQMRRIVVIDDREEVVRLLVERLRENYVVELPAFDGKPVDCVVYSPPFCGREDVPDLADAEAIFRKYAPAQIRQFVLVSSAAIYGATPQNPGLIRETRAPLRDDRFKIARRWAKLEQVAEKHFGENVALTVLRPTTVIVPGGGDYFSRLF
jgi:hypothetical protein